MWRLSCSRQPVIRPRLMSLEQHARRVPLRSSMPRASTTRLHRQKLPHSRRRRATPLVAASLPSLLPRRADDDGPHCEADGGSSRGGSCATVYRIALTGQQMIMVQAARHTELLSKAWTGSRMRQKEITSPLPKKGLLLQVSLQRQKEIMKRSASLRFFHFVKNLAKKQNAPEGDYRVHWQRRASFCRSLSKDRKDHLSVKHFSISDTQTQSDVWTNKKVRTCRIVKTSAFTNCTLTFDRHE